MTCDFEDWMVTLSVKVQRRCVEKIDELVTLGHYTCRSEAVRIALRNFLNEKCKYPGTPELSDPNIIMAISDVLNRQRGYHVNRKTLYEELKRFGIPPHGRPFLRFFKWFGLVKKMELLEVLEDG